jgi:hypothetical protein
MTPHELIDQLIDRLIDEFAVFRHGERLTQVQRDCLARDFKDAAREIINAVWLLGWDDCDSCWRESFESFQSDDKAAADQVSLAN